MKVSNEVKIGLTGTIALVVLFLGINFLKGMSLLHDEDFYYLQFDNAKGLSKNSTVFADGFNVGRVSNVVYDFNHPGCVIVQIAVNNQLKIPRASTVVLDEGVLGGCTLNMKLIGSTDGTYQPGDTIVGGNSNGLMDRASEMLPKAEPILARIDSLLIRLNNIAADPALLQIVHNTEELTKNLNQSSMHLNRLLAKDLPQMTQTFNTAGQNIVTLTKELNQLDLQTTLASVNTTIGNVNKMITLMQSSEGTLGKLMNDTRLYDNLNSTANSANILLQDLKQNPKRYVHFSLFGKKN